MGLFTELFHSFKKNAANKKLAASYSSLNRLAADAELSLENLRRIQKEVEASMVEVASQTGSKKATGALGVKKSLGVEKALIPELRRLAQETQERFFVAEQKVKETEPISEEEKEMMAQITSLLKDIRSHLPSERDIDSSLARPELLRRVTYALRNVMGVIKDYTILKKSYIAFGRKVRENELSPLLKKVFNQARIQEYGSGPKKERILAYTLTLSELRRLEVEAERINECNDPKYRIVWRYFWRKENIPEIDRATALKEKHVNVTIKLAGKSKKIHLLVA
jgi:hypothetical protein